MQCAHFLKYAKYAAITCLHKTDMPNWHKIGFILDMLFPGNLVAHYWRRCYNVLLETIVFTVSEVGSADIARSAGCCCGVDTVSAPGVDCCEDETWLAVSAARSLVPPLPSIILGQVDVPGDTVSRSLSALMASSLHNQRQQITLACVAVT